MNYAYPDEKGHYGIYGGRYVPETLMQSVLELEEAYKEAMEDEAFQKELNHYLNTYVGRETPLYFAENMTEYCGGAKIYLKREDLNHTGAHKINNTIGQALLAVRMGKKKLSLKQGWTTRCCNSYGMCPSRFRVRHLYGRRRCETSKIKCVSNGITRSESRKCSGR